MDVEQVIVWVHAFSTFVMVGLIWFVQVVHYPLFASVGREAFVSYEALHQRRTTWIVAPAMLAEALTALWLLASPVGDSSRLLPTIGVGLVIVVWLSTALVQVPCHTRLSGGFDSAVARRLVRTNWVRTAAWSARGVLVLAMGF